MQSAGRLSTTENPLFHIGIISYYLAFVKEKITGIGRELK